MLLYFGILYQNNCDLGALITRYCNWFYSSLLALSSTQFHSKLKTILFDQSLSLFAPTPIGSLNLPVIFTLSFIFTSIIYAGVCK